MQARSRTLPRLVPEIVGFGSFFRGKPRPKDVDLFVRCVGRPLRPDFARFAELLKAIRLVPSYQEQFQTPKEAMDAEYRRQDAPRLPGFDDGEVERGRFCEWLESYSWNMMYPDNMGEQVGIYFPEGYTKRMVKRRLPNINVVQFISADDEEPLAGLRSGFRVSLWTAEKAGHGRQPGGGSCARAGHGKTRFATFDRLKFNSSITAEVALLRAEIDLMFRIIRPQSPPEATWVWHKQWSHDHAELCDAQQLHREKGMRPRVTFLLEERAKPVPAEYYALTHSAGDDRWLRKTLRTNTTRWTYWRSAGVTGLLPVGKRLD